MIKRKDYRSCKCTPLFQAKASRGFVCFWLLDSYKKEASIMLDEQKKVAYNNNITIVDVNVLIYVLKFEVYVPCLSLFMLSVRTLFFMMRHTRSWPYEMSA